MFVFQSVNLFVRLNELFVIREETFLVILLSDLQEFGERGITEDASLQ